MFGLTKYEKEIWGGLNTNSLFNFFPKEPIHYQTNLMPITNQDEENYWFEFDVPGVEQEDIKVSLENGVVSITAKTETRDYSFARRLPKHVDTEKTIASYKNGVLLVTVPKSKKAKKIEIQVS